MRKRNLLKLISNIVFISIVAGGMLYQIESVGELYFQYDTVTKVDIDIAEVSVSRSISACLRYSDLLDYESLAKDEGRKDWYFTGLDEKRIRYYQDHLNVKEIFDNTPQEEEVLDKIILRINGSSRLTEFNHSNVLDYFNVEKFLYLEYMCYTVTKINGSDQVAPYQKIAISSLMSGLVYDITFTSAVQRVDSLKIVGHMPYSRPYRSIRSTSTLQRGYSQSKGLVVKNFYEIYQSYFIVNNLKPPYETQCFDYREIGFLTRDSCVETCINEEVNTKLKMVPFTFITTNKNTTLDMVCYNDVINDDFARKLFDIEEFCEKEKCKWRACWEATSVTIVNDYEGGDNFHIRLVLPLTPSYNVFVVALLEFIDFFSYVTSILSTYTGVSALLLSPMNVFQCLCCFRKHSDCKDKYHREYCKHPSCSKDIIAKSTNRISLQEVDMDSIIDLISAWQMRL